MEKTQSRAVDKVNVEMNESSSCTRCRLLLAALAVLGISALFALQQADARAPGDSGSFPASGGAGAGKEQGSLFETIEKMEPEKQIDYLKRLLEKGDKNKRIPFYMGNAMYGLGKLDSAQVYFEKAIAVDPSFSKAYVNLGLVLEAIGRPFEAKLKYKHAIKVNPNDVLAHCHLGFMAYSKKNYTEAMAYYRKALEIDPKNTQAHYYLGLAFADAHIFKEALREWELVAELDPGGDIGKTARENAKLIRQYMSVKVP